jgi:ferritin
MLTKSIESEINDQINREIYSAYLYISMAAYFDSLNLAGFSNWMKVQAQEEIFHATKFFNYVYSRGGRVTLKQIEAPPSQWKSPLDAFLYTYSHEQGVTANINNLVNLAEEERDRATYNLLQWYVDEQVEEESSADTIIQKLKLVGESGEGIFFLDKELATRVYVPPVSQTE